MRPLRAAAAIGAGFALAAGLIVLGHGAAEAQLGDAGLAEAGTDAGRIGRTPPDPPAMNERMQWVFVLRWEKNDVYLVSIHKTDMGEPHATPRVMGRFALELFEGPTLIERVRFDFPMLGAEEPGDGGFRNPPRFQPGLKTRIGVVFPATKRGTRLELWDRATNRRWPLPWPPTEGSYSDPAPDAGPREIPAK